MQNILVLLAWVVLVAWAVRPMPGRGIPVGHGAPLIEFLEASVNLIQLPSFRFHISGNGFSREERFGATCALCERLELVLGVAVDPH